MIREADHAISDGHSIRTVCPPRAIGLLLGLEGSQHPFSGTPSYKRIAHLPLADRVRKMRDHEFKRQFLSEDLIAESTFLLIERLSYAHMFVLAAHRTTFCRKKSIAAAPHAELECIKQQA